jgi:hypothetical protein
MDISTAHLGGASHLHSSSETTETPKLKSLGPGAQKTCYNSPSMADSMCKSRLPLEDQTEANVENEEHEVPEVWNWLVISVHQQSPTCV